MRIFTKGFSILILFLFTLSGLLFYPWSGSFFAVGADLWKQAAAPWKWLFPRDHGSHPDFRTEWWYFTGNLTDGSEKRFGYQLTFFRHGLFLKASNPADPWSVRDLYLGHFSLTDVSGGRFWYTERLSRKGPCLAEAAEEGMEVRLLGWQARMEGKGIKLEARHPNMELSLDLTPTKPFVLHGENGLSRKGPKPGQASYYYSYTDLETKGLIRTSQSQSSFAVRGKSWFDHEFGSNQLAPDQTGWDWFSLHFSDGRDLMIYFLRRKDGSAEPSSSGTLVSTTGSAIHLPLSSIRIDVLDTWRSPKSGARYPSRWKIRLASFGIEMDVASHVADQELVTKDSTGVIYWEGAVGGTGKSAGQAISCEGYAELTGYAGSLAGLF
jgi:predicted secreted hydrolase